MSMCKDAKKTLPKPKVGDFCSSAMEQGFSDACNALCMNQLPVSRLSQTCRAAAIELPRPTVRKWCEHGYSVAYEKTLEDLDTHFKHEEEEIFEERNFEEVQEEIQENVEEVIEEKVLEEPVKVEETRVIKAEIPVTIDENNEVKLLVYEGQNAEEAVVEFCRENVSDDIPACIRQLLPVVIEKLGE
eukprot:CAMPEP_0119037554 /NCGR_PEP_ID=MMETSP1177-20130426/5987_1 /TAXON_ID=2985 /ORGANISM="Ochromonas sp, Strain CCMP1899" /LENGTH=186 /DNA_ID=CAMNT_0006998999 /DNA_START=182 /DNA_END=742 /DNA_ORIENTATION=+